MMHLPLSAAALSVARSCLLMSALVLPTALQSGEIVAAGAAETPAAAPSVSVSGRDPASGKALPSPSGEQRPPLVKLWDEIGHAPPQLSGMESGTGQTVHGTTR